MFTSATYVKLKYIIFLLYAFFKLHIKCFLTVNGMTFDEKHYYDSQKNGHRKQHFKLDINNY